MNKIFQKKGARDFESATRLQGVKIDIQSKWGIVGFRLTRVNSVLFYMSFMSAIYKHLKKSYVFTFNIKKKQPWH